MLNKNIFSTLLLSLSLILPSTVTATIVEFQTSQGDFQVNLFDQTTPTTVGNFLNYLNEQHYTNSVIHRVSTDFVVQGGGYSFEGNWPLTALDNNSAIKNEPVYSNVKGTIAMAKSPSYIDSATNQWFFNLKDNSSNLDLQNGGFTVFGQVIGDGMAIVEKISQLELCTGKIAVGNTTSTSTIPMVDYTSQECTDEAVPGMENFVVIEQIVIIDSSEVTDAELTPAKNTLITAKPEPTPESGGGSFAWLSILFLTIVNAARLQVTRK